MKVLKRLSIIGLVLIVFIVGCRDRLSELTFQEEVSSGFSKKLLKQWYLQSFKKTEEWKAARLKVNKYPSFKKATYRKEQNLEIWEAPMVKQKSDFLVQAEKERLSAAQIRRVVRTSVSRVLFIKKPINAIVVREVNYIPFYAYLQKKNFDISDVGYGRPGNDFSGNMVIKDWKGNVISIRVFEEGKVIKKVSTKNIGKTRNPLLSSIQSQASTLGEVCEPVEYCMWYEDCVMSGDVMTDDCSEPYMDPTDCYIEMECYWDGEDEDPCALYGECDGDGSTEPPAQTNPCQEAQSSVD